MRATAQLLKAARWAASGQLRDRLHEYLRTRRQARQIGASPLFDAGWYCRQYDDIGTADPALHYLLQGAAEGRSPGPCFDGEWYLKHYPDVLIGGVNPLLHYIEKGRHQGREIAAVRAVRLPKLPITDANYRLWIQNYDTLDDRGRATVRARLAGLRHKPMFSIILLDGGRERGGRGLEEQLYPRWELGTGTQGSALGATGDFLVFLPPGAALAETALARMAIALDGEPGIDLLYADEDRIGPDGLRCDPDFKPDWDPELARSRDLIGASGAYRSGLVRELGYPDADTLPDFARRCAFRAREVRHVSGVLVHRQSTPAPARPSPASPTHSLLAFGRGEAGVPEPAPSVTVVIPTRDRARLLARCVDGLLRRTDYPDLEVILVDNDSQERRTQRLFRRLAADPRVRVLPFPGPLNWSAMNNMAVQRSRAEIIVLLNNDIDVIGPRWLREMVGYATRPGVGAVGAKLLYPDQTVQHAGIVLGPAGRAVHLMRHASRGDPGYQGQLVLTRCVSAVTGACMAMRRAVYLDAGGMEESELRVGYNDIDFCLRVRSQGYRVVFTPRAELFHLEAASRGLDATPEKLHRAREEREYMVRRWGALVDRDPFLNPNLCVVNERLAFASPPRLAG